jgi:hypothetical protein
VDGFYYLIYSVKTEGNWEYGIYMKDAGIPYSFETIAEAYDCAFALRKQMKKTGVNVLVKDCQQVTLINFDR